MKLLVLGAGGLLGSVLVERCLDRSISVIGTYHTEPPAFEIPLAQHDVRDTVGFETLLTEYHPDIVVNCAALTDVDGCGSDREAAFDINGQSPGKLASICSTNDVVFAHISTDYVFEGENVNLYEEAAPTEPIQVYGKSKLAGEISVREATEEAIITRLSFLYGIRGDTNELVGFPSWVCKRLNIGENVPLFTDQRFTPTRAGQAAETILNLLDDQARGTYHIASRSCVTPYDFGKKIAEILGMDEQLLTEKSQFDVSRPAERPKNSCLDVAKVENVLDRSQPTLWEDLKTIETHFGR